MSLLGKIADLFAPKREEPQDDELRCQRCGSNWLITVPTDDDYRLATVCGKCGLHSDDAVSEGSK